MSEAVKLSDVKDEIKELSVDMRGMVKAVTAVTKSVNTFITHMTLAEERHALQREENNRIHERCDKIEEILIDLRRTQDKELTLNTQIRKRYNWFIMAVAAMALTSIGSGIWFVIKQMAQAAI